MEHPPYRWIPVTLNAPFAPRDGAGALTFGNAMYLIGGWNPADKQHFPRICNNEVWRSGDGRDWQLVKPNTFLDDRFNPLLDWEGRHTAGYVVHRGRMWIVGGDCNQRHYQSDVWSSANGRDWQAANSGRPAPWGPRCLQYVVAHHGRIFLMGGQTMPAFSAAPEAFFNDVWSSEDGATWHKLQTRGDIWSPRGMIGGSAVFRDHIWILGGGTYDTPTTPVRRFHHDVWSSPDGIDWTCHLEHAPWNPRQYHDVAVFDDHLWVMEGYYQSDAPAALATPGNRKDVWYSPDGVQWHELPDTPWAPRHAASVFVHDDALWMVAGNNMTSDVWKLVPN